MFSFAVTMASSEMAMISVPGRRTLVSLPSVHLGSPLILKALPGRLHCSPW